MPAIKNNCLLGQTLRVLAFLLATALLVSCVSLSARIADLSRGNYYAEALTTIQKAEVKAKEDPSKDSLDELTKAKSLFASVIENDFAPRIQIEMKAGRTFHALELAKQGLNFCPWSDQLADQTTILVATIHEIETIEGKWAETIETGIVDPKAITELKTDLYSLKGSISDAKGAKRLNELLQLAIFAGTLEQVRITKLKVTPVELEKIKSDVASIETDKENERATAELIDLAFRLVNANPREGSDGSWKRLYSSKLGEADRNMNDRLLQALQASFENWAVSDFCTVLQQANSPLELLDQAEELLSQIGNLRKSELYVGSLAAAHLNRALHLNHGGVSSSIAKIHFGRAMATGADRLIVATEVEKANSFLLKTSLPRFYLDFSINPKIPLDVQDTIFANYFSNFLSHSRKGSPWTFDSTKAASTVRVEIDDGDLIFPQSRDLTERVSMYLDHYENVRNPYKDSLELEVSWKKSAVDQALQSYNWQVSSYNMNPTQFGLNQVNYAYSAYKQSINDYNRSVDNYNNTPSLIKRPVSLSYTYKDGYWSLGYSLKIRIAVDDISKSISSRSVDRGYLKIGTKYNDLNENNRVDQPWRYDLSVDSFLRHVNAVNREIDDDAWEILSNVSIPTVDELSRGEKIAASFVFHPWGVDLAKAKKSAIPAWMIPYLADAGPIDAKLSVPIQQLQASRRNPKNYPTAQALVQDLSGTVVLVRNYSKGVVFSTGSGTLVGPNGLILTCAHVLSTSDIRIAVLENGTMSEYTTETVFSNETNDVALIRASKLKNTTWATLRLTTETAKGEKIVAIGSPSLGGNMLNVGGVTEGIVSNPLLDDGDQSRIVGDITIASGSSGGPVFSLSTGEVVGVVQAVTQIGLNNTGVSSSGYFALGAPSQKLPEWLGLKY